MVAFALAFADHGYLAVNLNDVLHEMGLTKGAFYFHFQSKDDVAREIVQRYFDQAERMRQAALDSDADVLDTLIETVRHVCRMFQTDPIARGGSRLSFERSVIEAELPRPFVTWIETLTALLRSGQARHHVSPHIDAGEYAQFVVAYLHGAMQVSGELTRRQDLLSRLGPLWNVIIPALEATPGRVRETA